MQMAIPTGIGWWLDSMWKTTPWFMISGVVLGFVAAMLELIKLARDFNSANSQSRSRGPEKKQEGGK
jgi:F0F1-type ATP synthase assembly protein I